MSGLMLPSADDDNAPCSPVRLPKALELLMLLVSPITLLDPRCLKDSTEAVRKKQEISFIGTNSKAAQCRVLQISQMPNVDLENKCGGL